METKDDSLESSTIAALLSYSETARHSNIQDISPKFSSLLKTNFENRNLWLRFGLTLALTHESPRSALQAFNECLRIDQHDPLPAMLAAKIMLEDLDEPDDGLELVKYAIDRCLRLVSPKNRGEAGGGGGGGEEEEEEEEEDGETTLSSATTQEQDQLGDQQLLSLESNNHNQQQIVKLQKNITPSTLSSTSNSHSYLEAKCCYKNIPPLLSKCYLLASIMHAHIYEREPESIKQLKKSNLNASLKYLDLAEETYSNDYLLYFHKALHEAKQHRDPHEEKQKSYSKAIDNIRKAIELNPHHVPSMQLLILLLSALKLYNEALILCESTLHEFEDNLLLLHIKCNLEQRLVETKGYKTALNTAQHILKCIRRTRPLPPEVSTGEQEPAADAKQITNLFPDANNQATKSLRENIYTSGDELSAWLLVAEIFIKLGSIEDAESCVEEGSTHTNGALSYQIMYIKGLIAKAKNDLIEAKNYFQSSLALHPRYADGLQQMAHVHYLLGNYSTAEKFLKDSLDVDKSCHKTWYYLSRIYIETKEHDKANKCIKEASQLEESSPVINISAVISRLTLE